MKSFARIAVLSAFLAPVIAWAEEPKPAEKTAKSADEFTKAYVVGVVTGEVTKISATSVTLKVPEVVQTGTTRSRAGGHSISVPKLSVK